MRERSRDRHISIDIHDKQTQLSHRLVYYLTHDRHCCIPSRAVLDDRDHLNRSAHVVVLEDADGAMIHLRATELAHMETALRQSGQLEVRETEAIVAAMLTGIRYSARPTNKK